MPRRCRPLLGTYVEIECDRAEAIERGFAAIERVHRLMSAHEPDSELSRTNRFAHLRPVPVAAETFEVLERALHWSRLSNGAFDVVRAGARANLPLHPGQPEPDESADWTVVRLDGCAVSLERPARLDLGGIAKGYAVDLAVAGMQQSGAAFGLVNAGGDLRAFGNHGWPITIVEPGSRRPVAQVELGNAALATSAGRPAVAGLAFDHVLDRCPQWLSVTVRAPNACGADALTKIVWALGHRSADLLGTAKADAFAIRADGRFEAIVEEVAVGA